MKAILPLVFLAVSALALHQAYGQAVLSPQLVAWQTGNGHTGNVELNMTSTAKMDKIRMVTDIVDILLQSLPNRTALGVFPAKVPTDAHKPQHVGFVATDSKDLENTTLSTTLTSSTPNNVETTLLKPEGNTLLGINGTSSEKVEAIIESTTELPIPTTTAQ